MFLYFIFPIFHPISPFHAFLTCYVLQYHFLANRFSFVQACPFLTSMCLLSFHLWIHVSSLPLSLIHRCLCGCDCWLAGLAGTCGQCLCVVSGTGPLWGRLFPHCAPPRLGRSVRSRGLLECKPSVPLSNPPSPSYMATIYAFCLCYQPKIDAIYKYVVGLANWTRFIYHIFDIKIACLFIVYVWSF